MPTINPTRPYSIPGFRIALVREPGVKLAERPEMRQPAAAARVLAELTPHKSVASGKYDPLYQHLMNVTAQSVVMTFAQVALTRLLKRPGIAILEPGRWPEGKLLRT